MSKKNWDKVAQQEFDTMPAEYQEDWGELRGVVYRNRHQKLADIKKAAFCESGFFSYRLNIYFYIPL